MFFNRFYTQVEVFCDVLVRVSFGHEFQRLFLAMVQCIPCADRAECLVGIRSHVTGNYLCRYIRTQVGLAVQYATDRDAQLIMCRVLWDVAVGACPQGFVDILSVLLIVSTSTRVSG